MFRRTVLAVGVAAGLCICASQASAVIVIDDQLTDDVTNLMQFDGKGMLKWAPISTSNVLGLGGWHGSGGGSDLAMLSSFPYQNNSYKLTESVNALQWTVRNTGTAASLPSSTVGGVTSGVRWGVQLVWYDSTNYTGATINTGRITTFGAPYTLPSIPAGGSLTISVPLTDFVSGTKSFGDTGDAFGFVKLENAFNGATTTGVTDANLFITDIRLVMTPEPATMGLVLLGSLGMLLRRRQV